MIRAVFFDAADTLIHLPRGVGHHYRVVAARHGLQVDEDRLNLAFRAAFRATPARGSERLARVDDDKGWWRQLVRRVFTECGHTLEEEPFSRLFEELYNHFAQPGVWEPYPEVRDTLTALQRHWRLGIISNFDRRLYPVLEHMGLRTYFETITISSELGLEKPDARIFQAALQAMALSPGEALHAGDHPEQDWRGAEAAGLHVFRLQRPANTLRDLVALLHTRQTSRVVD